MEELLNLVLVRIAQVLSLLWVRYYYGNNFPLFDSMHYTYILGYYCAHYFCMKFFDSTFFVDGSFDKLLKIHL